MVNHALEMETGRKVCGGCRMGKPFSEFNKSSRSRHGLHNHCRDCQRLSKRRYYLANMEKEKSKSAARGKDHAVRAAAKARYAADHAYRASELEKNRVRRRTPDAREKANAARARLVDRSPTAKLAIYSRIRVRKALQGVARSASTMALIGCDADALRLHMERQFKPGMSWDNYGYRGWHVDHIRPCASFDLTDPDQQQECFHYTNLRPEWRYDNQSKGSKLLDEKTAARLRRKYAKAREALTATPSSMEGERSE